MALRILCIDDNDLISGALQRRIEREEGLEWVGFVNDSSRIVESVREFRPDVVLMDVDIPGADTFKIIEQLTAELPDVRVVMCSGYVNRAYIERALDSGAWGYLSKNDDVDSIIGGIQQAGRGEIALSHEVDEVWRRAKSSDQRWRANA